MSKVVLGMSTSLDGIAGGSSEADFMTVHEAILGWVFDLRSWRQAQGMDGGRDSVDSEVWAEDFERIGAQIVGRTMFDFGFEPWGENPPFHAPVFVHTHRGGAPIEKLGGTTYTFVTDGIGSAVDQARAAAGGKDVLIAGGIQVAQAALQAGLVDEIAIHVAPVLLGRGIPLLDAFGDAIALKSTRVVHGEGAVHLTYDVMQ
jgi:dihydrofolate reductase